MKKLLLPISLAALLVPGVAAQSVFEGTWKADFSTANFPSKPFEQVLKDGVYSCKTCIPSYTVKADGTDQPKSGDPYSDTLAVKVLSDHEVQFTNKKGGKVVGTSKSTVSSDGTTLTNEFSDSSSTNGGPPVTGKLVVTRVGELALGSHAISGAWRAKNMDSMSDNGITWTYKLDGDKLVMTTPTGQSYTAKLDGTEAPFKGDPGTTSVRMKLIGSDTLEETDLRDGEIMFVSRMTVGADGKRAKITTDDKRQKTSSTIEAAKQ